MKKWIMLCLLIFVVSTNIFAQENLIFSGKNDKTLKKIKQDSWFTGYLQDKQTGDTIISVFISGYIKEITATNFSLYDYTITEDYRLGKERLAIVNEYSDFSDSSAYQISPDNITTIPYDPALKKAGGGLIFIGALAVGLAPIISINFKDVDNYHARRYLWTSAAGIGIMLVGFTLNISIKGREIRLKQRSTCEPCDGKIKFIDGKLRVD